MTTLALIADWCGPFASIEEARAAAKKFELAEVLYFATGKRAYQRKSTLQYVGISNDPQSRLSNQHHKLPEIKTNFSVWIGEISSHAVAGRKAKIHPVAHSQAVEAVEWALAYFLALPLNKKKRRRPPPRGLIVISRWFQADFDTPRTHRGHKDWPDYIEFEPDYGTARIQWFGRPGRSKRLSEADIQALAIEPSST